MSLDHFYPKCVIRWRARFPPSDWMHLKGLGPRLSSPRWRWFRTYAATGEGKWAWPLVESRSSTIHLRMHKNSAQVIYHFHLFRRRLRRVRADLGCFFIQVALLPRRRRVCLSPSSPKASFTCDICFTVLHYKMCIHVASDFFYFIFNNAEFYL